MTLLPTITCLYPFGIYPQVKNQALHKNHNKRVENSKFSYCQVL